MGNSDNSPNDGKLSLDTSAPLWSAILSDVSKGMKIEGFARTKPKGLVTATVDAFTGLKPGGATRKTVEELFLPGTAPTKSASYSRAVDVDAASGLLWREGCVGPMETQLIHRLQQGRGGLQGVAEGRRRVAGSGGPRPRRPRRTQGHQDGLLLRLRQRHQLVPLRPQLGWLLRPHEEVPDRAAAALGVRVDRSSLAVPVDRAAASGNARQARQDAQALTGRSPAAGPHDRQSRTMVAPSPPSPRSPARRLLTSGCDAA